MGRKGRPRVRDNGRNVSMDIYVFKSATASGTTSATARATTRAKQQIRHTNQLKLDVIDCFRDSGDIQHTITAFFPTYSRAARLTMSKNIYLWRAQRETIGKRCETPADAKNKYNRANFIATTLSQAAEEEILKWVNMLRSEGVPISNLMLHEKAKAVAAERGVAPFEGSWSWHKAFRKRHKLSIRAETRQGQIAPADAEARAIEFGKEAQRVIMSLRVTTVHNADQTAVLFEYLPRVTINEKSAKTVWVRCAGYEKRRVTVMLHGDSEGNRYPPFLVMKSPPSAVEGGNNQDAEKRNGFGVHVWKKNRSDSRARGHKNSR